MMRPFLFVLVVLVVMKRALAFSMTDASTTKTNTAPLDISRRDWLLGSAMAWGLTSPSSAVAAGSPMETFDDAKLGFSIKLPADWKRSEQLLADRRKLLVWTDPSDPATAVFIAYTSVRDDFTSLGSFGSVDQVAQTAILPKTELMDPNSEVSATMLSAVSQKQAYIFDYKQKVGSVQPETHFRTIFALQQGATGGAGAVLVTITAQTPESRYNSVQQTLDSIIDSYGKIAQAS